MHRRLPALQGFVMAWGTILAGPAMAAPQTFNTALPVAEGEFVLREQAFYRRATGDPTRADRERSVSGLLSVLGYGVKADLAVFAALPWLDKSLDLSPPGGERIRRGASGFGDARLLARYTLYQRNRPGHTFRIAPFLGLELPTGEDRERDRLGALPAPLQPGSGSWDPLGGIVVTWQALDYEVDAQLAYKDNTRANGFEFGDELNLDASMQYRLWPRKLGPGLPAFLYGGLEANLHHRERNELKGIEDPDSGGTSLFLSPSLQYVTRRWVLEAVVQLPVVQELNGTALEDDYIVRAGFRIAF